MNGTQLYDANSQAIYPNTYGGNVESGVVIPGYTVNEDLEYLLNQYRSLRSIVSGGLQVSNSLRMWVGYATSTSDSKSAAEGILSYSDQFQLPNDYTPYTWQKIIYYWDNDPIKTEYVIVATALYPETLVMYTALASDISGAIEGPASYGEEDILDLNSASGVKWYNYFPGISADKPYGYMATRHRNAGESFPIKNNKLLWHMSLFAMYPIKNSSGN